MYRGTQRDEYAESDVHAVAVRSFQCVWHDPCRQAATKAGVEAAPRVHVARVPRLQLGNGEDRVGAVDVEIVCRLPDELESPEPGIALGKRDVGLRQKRMRRLTVLGVAPPGQRRRPDTAGAHRAVVGRRSGDTSDVDSRAGIVRSFSLGKVARRELQGHGGRRHEPEAAGVPVEGSEVEVGASLVGFAAVEDRGFGLPSLVVDTAGHDTEGNVGRVEPVVRNRRERIWHRRQAVGISGRAEGRLARRPTIRVPAQAPRKRPIVFSDEFHEQIVRVLAVMNARAIAHLTARQQVRVTRNRELSTVQD